MVQVYDTARPRRLSAGSDSIWFAFGMLILVLQPDVDFVQTGLLGMVGSTLILVGSPTKIGVVAYLDSDGTCDLFRREIASMYASRSLLVCCSFRIVAARQEARSPSTTACTGREKMTSCSFRSLS